MQVLPLETPLAAAPCAQAATPRTQPATPCLHPAAARNQPVTWCAQPANPMVPACHLMVPGGAAGGAHGPRCSALRRTSVEAPRQGEGALPDPDLTLTLTTDPNPGPNQVAYAGLFLAQHFAQTCRGAAAAGGRSGGGGGSCYKFVHDGRERCVAGGRPRCDGAAL